MTTPNSSFSSAEKDYWAITRQVLSVILPGLFMLAISLIGLRLSSEAQNNQEDIRGRQQHLLNMVDSSRGAQLFFKNQQESWRNMQELGTDAFLYNHNLREYKSAVNLVKRQLAILLAALNESDLKTELTLKIISLHDRLTELNEKALSKYSEANPIPWLEAAHNTHGLEQQLSNRFGTLIGSVVVQATNQIRTQNEESDIRWQQTRQLLIWITVIGVLFTSGIAWLNQRANRRVSHTLNTLQFAKNELVRTEKLAALGALVAGISHELNTPLGNCVTITSSLDQWVKDIDTLATTGTMKRSDLTEYCDQTKQGYQLLSSSLTRANEIVSSFKQVAVDQSSDRKRSFSLHDLVEEIVITLMHQFKHTPYELIFDIPENIQINGHPGALVQILNNLILNALKHGLTGLEQGEVRITAKMPLPGRVQITVSDTGAGIPKTIASKIFDPFFSTKMGEGGSGLGLYIVHNIATGTLGGSLWLDSKRSHTGATFILDIPMNASVGAGGNAHSLPQNKS